jgi:hypothetical protein
LTSSPPISARTDDRRRDVAIALGAVLGLAVAVTFAFQPARAFTSGGFVALAAAGTALAAVAVARARARGEGAVFRPKSGDLTLAALVAAAFYAIALGARPALFPRGQIAEIPFLLAYVPLLDPLSDGRHAVAIGVALLAALEEIVLRALVQPALTRSVGSLRGWLVAAALDALVWAPTALLLADPRAGWNGVYVGFALAVALATGWLRVRTERAIPAILARALLVWGLIEFPIWSP